MQILCRTILLSMIFWQLIFSQNLPKSAFVVNSVANTLSVINLENNHVILDTLSAGVNSYPNAIALRNGKGYVINSGHNSITVFKQETLQKIKTIHLPNGVNPWDIEFISDDLAAVSFFATDVVAIIDVQSDQILHQISVGTSPEGIAFVNGKIFVANSGFINVGVPYDPGTVSVIDTTNFSVVNTIAVGTNPQDLARDAEGNIWVACTGNYTTIGSQLDKIDQQTLQVSQTISMSTNITTVNISPDHRVFLGTFGSGVLAYNIATQSFERDANNPLPGGPDVDFDTDGQIYVVEFGNGIGSGHLTVYDSAYVEQHSFGVNIGPVALEIYDPAVINIEDLKGPLNVVENIHLSKNYPNPFNPTTHFDVSIHKAGVYRIEIFNIQGQKISTVFAGDLPTGKKQFTWSGRNSENQQVSSGIYFVQLSDALNKNQKSIKINLMK